MGLRDTACRAERLYGRLVLARIHCRSRQEAGGDELTGDELAAAAEALARRGRRQGEREE